MKTRWMALLMVVIGLGIASYSMATVPAEAILSGTVYSAETGDVVEGALVFVRICVNEGEGMHGIHTYSATTNEAGEYVISGVPEGEWTAVARKKLVGRDEETVIMQAGNETVMDFELVPAEIPGGLMHHLRHHGDQNE